MSIATKRASVAVHTPLPVGLPEHLTLFAPLVAHGAIVQGVGPELESDVEESGGGDESLLASDPAASAPVSCVVVSANVSAPPVSSVRSAATSIACAS